MKNGYDSLGFVPGFLRELMVSHNWTHNPRPVPRAFERNRVFRHYSKFFNAEGCRFPLGLPYLALRCRPTLQVVRLTLLLAAINASTAYGAQLLVRSSNNNPTKRTAEKLVLNAARSGVQGLLLVPPYAELLVGSAVLSELKATAIAAAGPLPGMHTVRIDNRSAARELTTFLIRLRHRRIGFISGPPTHGDSLERRAGYQDALRKAGIPLRVALAREGDFTFESGRVAARHILDLRNRPTAIVASNDDMASGVLWAAQQRRLELPGDLSVAGFDDTPTALKSWPPLTVIRQPIERMVEHGVSLLLDSARAPAMSAPHDVVFGYTLVERASTSAVGARPRRRPRPDITE
jgi:LacI family transcriptional regulator